MRTAHPRSRGENNHLDDPLEVVEGSSPLTRGKPPVRRVEVIDVRLIPAHAGKTQRRTRCSSTSRAHPRSRGENEIIMTDTIKPTGSSPLTRGKRDPLTDRNPDEGLIPAHAGKTQPPRPDADTIPAHPRSRGENPGDQTAYYKVQGSSPLTRGKPSLRLAWRAATGLIPAHAGKTRSPAPKTSIRTAHPRSRGENTRRSALQSVAGGSSPLTRGKHSLLVNLQDVAGLIPAHAGKTSRPQPTSSRPRAHPRSRGENRWD